MISDTQFFKTILINCFIFYIIAVTVSLRLHLEYPNIKLFVQTRTQERVSIQITFVC